MNDDRVKVLMQTLGHTLAVVVVICAIVAIIGATMAFLSLLF